MRAGEPVGEVGIVLPLGVEEVRVQEGVEDELVREAEEVERARAVLPHERTHRVPVLAQHELGRGPLALGRVEMAAARLRDHGLLAGPDGGDEERLRALADVGVGVGDEPVGRLHHV